MNADVVLALNTWVSGMVDDLTGLLVTNLPVVGTLLVTVIGIFFIIKIVRAVGHV